MLRFRHMRSLQKFASVHGSAHTHFNSDRSRSSRAAALPGRRGLCAAKGTAPLPLQSLVRIGLTAPTQVVHSCMPIHSLGLHNRLGRSG